MNLVQTLPELKKASLNGVQGLGYAESIETVDQKGVIHGVIVFDEDANLTNLAAGEQQDNVFEGTIYHDGYETVETMAVEILMVNRDDFEPGATFIKKPV